jgi:hypothetical protein
MLVVWQNEGLNAAEQRIRHGSGTVEEVITESSGHRGYQQADVIGCQPRTADHALTG